MHAIRVRLALPALLLASLAASAQSQGFVGPFEKGLRWTHSANLTTPWIPSCVEFAARGELVWVCTEGANRHLLLLDGTGTGVVQPTEVDEELDDASFILAVEAGANPRQLFSLAQFPEPDPFERRTVLSSHDALVPSSGVPFGSQWSFSCGFVANGPAELALDELGEVVAFAVYSNTTSTVRVHRLDASTGALLMQVDLPADSLNGLELSGDGEVLALGIGRKLVVLDSLGNELHGEQLESQAFDLALDEDGSRLVCGSPERLSVYDYDGQSFHLVQEHQGQSNEAPLRVAVSADGGTYAGAWYRYVSTDSLRLEVYDASHSLQNMVVQPGLPGGPQNSPAGLELTADGRRIALASWGQGNSLPEVLLLERGVPQPVLEIDLPGSAMGLDLDASGTRIAVVTKNLHANQVGTTGEVRLYETGERDLAQLAPARLGQSLEVASLEPGAALGIFLVGVRASKPTSLPGMQGQLHLARTSRLRVFGRAADATGRADLSMPIPMNSGMVGVDLSVQVANRVAGRIVFSDTVLDPLIR
jgi:hypothetical protein